LCKYISENTDYKVVVAGECSDEMLGYVYFRMAPDTKSFQKETEKLLREIHLYDGLRADRCISHFGLEGRFPFSDSRFVQLVLSIDPKWKMHSEERMEKAILRQSFAELMPILLPSEVLWRRKVAMSDGTSLLKRSWSDIVKEYIHNIQCNSRTAIKLKTDVIQCVPISEESEYYRAVWQSYYDEKVSHILEHFWLPNQEWFAESVMDPSARTLKIYKDVEK
jgi:asparagine synthase (glutamine-hydrolysing)